MTDPLEPGGANPWQTLASRVIYDNSRLRVVEDSVVQPDGEPGAYTYIQVPWPIVAVVPVTQDRQVYLVRQWRYPWGRNSWEIPAGHGEPHEPPLLGAQRELAEEVGLEAGTWEALGTGYASAAVSAEYHLFLALDLRPATVAAERDGAEHDMIARAVPLKDAIQAAVDGRIVHAFSVVGLLRAARRLGL